MPSSPQSAHAAASPPAMDSRCSRSPIPESISSCGVLNAPPQSTTSPCAATNTRSAAPRPGTVSPGRRLVARYRRGTRWYSTPIARGVSPGAKSTLVTSVSVRDREPVRMRGLDLVQQLARARAPAADHVRRARVVVHRGLRAVDAERHQHHALGALGLGARVIRIEHLRDAALEEAEDRGRRAIETRLVRLLQRRLQHPDQLEVGDPESHVGDAGVEPAGEAVAPARVIGIEPEQPLDEVARAARPRGGRRRGPAALYSLRSSLWK